MGLVKQSTLDYEGRGYSRPADKFVCANHFSDDSIIQYIENNSEEGICNYCKLRYQSGKVVHLETLVEFINDGIIYFYGEANDECVSYDSSEGGWQGAKVFDAYDLLRDEIGLEIDSEPLFQDILKSFSDYEWCRKDPYALTESQELTYDWKRFCELTKHKIRYSFFKTTEFDSDPNNDFSDILREIALGIDTLNLIKKIDINTKIYRFRQHKKDDIVSSIADLASPPVKYAVSANRMSPAGISMFYGAFERDTAELETKDIALITAKPILTFGIFITKKELQVIDLTNLPPLPSIFDSKNRKYFNKILFLKSFVADLSQNIVRDEKIHIEYVPTQIVTEYFRYVFPEISKIKIDGIIYPSSKGKLGNCCVLFFDNKECVNVFDLIKTEKIDLM